MPKKAPHAEAPPEKPALPYYADIYHLNPSGYPYFDRSNIAEPTVAEAVSTLAEPVMTEVAGIRISDTAHQMNNLYLTTLWENGVYQFECFDDILKADCLSSYSAEMLARFLKQVDIRSAAHRQTLNPFDGLVDLPPLSEIEAVTLEDHERRCRELAARAIDEYPHLEEWYRARGIIDSPDVKKDASEPYWRLTITNLEQRDITALIHGLAKPTMTTDMYTHKRSPTSSWQIPGHIGFLFSKESKPGSLTFKLEPGTDKSVIRQAVKEWLDSLAVSRAIQTERLRS